MMLAVMLRLSSVSCGDGRRPPNVFSVRKCNYGQGGFAACCHDSMPEPVRETRGGGV